jgi:hypothetical protein
MTRYAPLYQQADTYTATLDRSLIGAVWPTGGLQGGVVTTVTGTMNVNIASGQVAVPMQAGQGSALCWWDATEVVTLTAAPPTGQSRIDVIVAQVRDNQLDAGSNNDFLFQAVAGTATTGTPAVPATPVRAYAIAQVLVPGNVTNLNTATVTAVANPLAPWPAYVEVASTPPPPSAPVITPPEGLLWVDTSTSAGPQAYPSAYMQTLSAPTVASSPYTIAHNLGTTTPVVQMWDAVTNQMVMAQVVVQDTNHIQVSVAQNMPNNVNVIILGSAQAPAPINPADYANKSYVDARTTNLPAPVTSGTTVQSFTDVLNDVWVAKNGVRGGNWRRARDVLRARVFRTANVTASTVNSWNWIPYDTTGWDEYGMVSLGVGSPGPFTCPLAGAWQLNAAANANANPGRILAGVAKNGGIVARGVDINASVYGVMAMDIMQMVAGDTAGFATFVSASTTFVGDASGTFTYMTVEYHGPPIGS